MKYLQRILGPALLVATAGAAPVSPPSVVDIRAHLFCDRTGEFTQNIFDIQPLVLWNTIIGEGSAGCASSATLVLTVVRADPDVFHGEEWVEIRALKVAEDGSDPVLLSSREQHVGITGPDGLVHIPMWLYETGCDLIRIEASIRGGSGPGASALLPFRCGE